MDNDAHAAEESRRLLLDVLPLFTSTPDRVDSTKHACFQAYHILICAEAKILEGLLNHCDIRAPQYADILGKVLKLFESLVKPDIISPSTSFLHIHDCKYERLPALRSRLQDMKSNCGSSLILQNFLHFGDRQEETRDIHWALIKFNKAFSDNEDNLPSWGIEDKLHKSRPAYEVRQHAMTLYETLLDKLPVCGKAEHEAKLCLARYVSSEELDPEIGFDMLFSTHTPRWQESKIRVIVQRIQGTTPRVRFDASPPKKRIMQREIGGTICSLIESTAKARGYLYMLVDHNRKIYRVLSETPQRSAPAHTHNSISMKAIIRKLETETHDRKNPILGRTHKRIIAVLLAHALVQYCGSAWLSEYWDKTKISFLRHSSGDRLVLSTSLKPHNPEPDLDAEGRVHSYPGILALAILMLEMELGKTIETARSKQEDCMDDEESNINTDFNVAWSMFDDDEIQDDTIPGFKAAVKACLNFSYWNEDTKPDDLINHREKLYDDITLRRKIYQEIVMPLERELYMSFPDLNLDEPLKFAFWDRVEVPSLPTSQNRKATFNPASTISDIVLKQSHDTRTSIIKIPPVSEPLNTTTRPQVFFHDVLISVSDENRRRSEGWMERFMSARDSLIDRIRIDDSNKFETSRVKVAVLDTGIDWSDSYIRGAEDRIVEWKNWADDRDDKDSQQQVYDNAGHGTHVTALLLKTAPEAKVYISRVANQNGAIITAERIAEAIKHAVEAWEVDIITMSFGFQKPITIINRAIKYANSHDVIMFAATSNGGGNEEVAFPASAHDYVIGVNSTDAWGGKSDFTPNVLPLSENFSILGEAVESSWPKHLEQGPRQCRSGTSYATPIAAGTAANMLFYVRMKVDNEERVKEVTSCRGMKKLLLSMAAPTDGYSYVRPWVLWRKDDEDILAQIRTAFA